ncbi:P-loop containing nucleoside triphosphate hydrolase protein [Dendrothele bispora CBS 962.96]|uniref:DNA helicase n=1 Tax=Dendrothele bispora (strain CBS 962.96) TaxID=1314807 RepID=A0A4V4HCR1_DENBC|nr:P-loop containing nucleoside triphosphate hydrolase protein [Dendrothele bispora CBS 962.96]
MTSDASLLSSFIARQRVLLKRERDADIERSSLLLSNCGPKLLEQKGLALLGLGVVGVNVGLGGKTLIELERPSAYHTSPIFPPHTLRTGDIARIEPNVSSTGPTKKPKKAVGSADTKDKDAQAEGVVYKISETRIVIAVDPSDSSSDDLNLPERCRVVKLANSVTYDRMDRAIDYLERTVLQTPSSDNGKDKSSPPELTPLVQVLMAMKRPAPKLPVPPIQFFDETLNPSQREAIKFCLESPEVACIHGPPGTGKTHTLIEIIRQLARNPSARVLVCGASNLSVDNILERLLALPAPDSGEKLKVTRIGHPARVMANEGVLSSTLEVKASRTDQAALVKDVKNELEATLGVLSGKGKGRPKGLERKKMWEEVKALRKEYRQREGGIVTSVLGESQVVLATCHSSGGRQLRNHQFDVVIIDEATQALEAVCWIPIMKAKKLILAGDPMQLPPTILSLDKKKDKPSKKTMGNKAQKGGSKVTKSDKTKTVGKGKGGEKSKNTKVGSGSETQDQDIQPPPDSEDSGDEDSGADTEAKEDEEAPKTKTTKVNSSSKTTVYPRPLRPPHTLETTLFDRLERIYGPSIKKMLDVQYRMHEKICEFPSKTLYEGKLESHGKVKGWLLEGLVLENGEGKIDGMDEEEKKEVLGTPVAFYDTAGCEYFERIEGEDGGDEGSKCNENEAQVVVRWVESMVNAGIKPEQIAVITPYQAQVTLLTTLLRPLYGSELEIGTVDGMQGREKDAVGISLVRSNDQREVGFLKEKRRLNVAMTRAKRHLCIVGDSSTIVHGGSYLKKWMKWLEGNADVRYADLE